MEIPKSSQDAVVQIQRKTHTNGGRSSAGTTLDIHFEPDHSSPAPDPKALLESLHRAQMETARVINPGRRPRSEQ